MRLRTLMLDGTDLQSAAILLRVKCWHAAAAEFPHIVALVGLKNSVAMSWAVARLGLVAVLNGQQVTVGVHGDISSLSAVEAVLRSETHHVQLWEIAVLEYRERRQYQPRHQQHNYSGRSLPDQMFHQLPVRHH